MDMDAHCTSIQKLIDNVNATVPNFMESVTQAKQANCNIAAELRIAKEHMSKLKFNFVEMRTKTGFLEKLCNYEIGSTPSSVISDEAMTEAKTQVKDLKTENTDLQDGIQSIMHDILEQQQHFQTQSEAAKELIQRYAAAQERVQQKRAVLEEQKQQLGGRQQLVSEVADYPDTLWKKKHETFCSIWSHHLGLVTRVFFPFFFQKKTTYALLMTTCFACCIRIKWEICEMKLKH
eukprot:m.167024 g.167024  ORF g.167024 m.167024 type:complete len:234 (-) comp16444_c1_seq1:1207-1908(-)